MLRPLHLRRIAPPADVFLSDAKSTKGGKSPRNLLQSSTVDGLLMPHSHRLGPLATIDGGNLRFEIGDDVRREGADVQKDHYHHHDIFQSPRIGARAG